MLGIADRTRAGRRAEERVPGSHDLQGGCTARGALTTGRHASVASAVVPDTSAWKPSLRRAPTRPKARVHATGRGRSSLEPVEIGSIRARCLLSPDALPGGRHAILAHGVGPPPAPARGR